MRMYITTGTYEFLKLLKEKHSNKNLLLMSNPDHSLLLHETNDSSIFQSSRTYEIIETVGEIGHEQFVAMNHVPVNEEEKPLFEHLIKGKLNLIKKEDGFISLKFLRPVHSEVYVLITSWKKELQFQHWQLSETYQSFFQKEKKIIGKVFSTGPYLATYYIGKDE